MTPARPRIWRNDYKDLDPAVEPRLGVSVVIPAHGGQDKLDLVLAALAAQTYPAHLTEVIVADDGSDPPLRVPEIAPENTRIVRCPPDGWGSGHAVHTGVLAAEGDIIQRVDADMILCREHLAAMAAWHHVVDYAVTIGYKRFIELPTNLPEPAALHKHVSEATPGELFDLSQATPSSTEKVIDETDGLRSTTSHRGYNVVTGPTLAMRRWLYDSAGGFDGRFALGSDTEFGYRLAMAGALMIPEKGAQAIHLGLPAMRGRREEAFRYTAPTYTQRIPLRRDLRRLPGGQWEVPYVDVVVLLDGATMAQVRSTAAGVLGGPLSDVRLTLVAPWSSLSRGRRKVLDDADLDLQLIRETFGPDPRIRLLDEAPPTSAPSPFRFVCPAGWEGDLAGRLPGADDPGDGVIIFPDGTRLERTAAVSRAVHLREPDEDLDTVIDQVCGVRKVEPEPDAAPEPALEPEAALEPALEPEAASEPAPEPETAPPAPEPKRRGVLGRIKRKVAG